MRNQRVTSATLGLALLAASAPGWAADEQENPPAPDNPSYAAEVQSIPSVAKPIKGQAGATGLVEGQSLTLTTRNFYSRENMKDSFTFRIPKAGGGSQRIHQRNAWVQGTVLKYSSGYTQGTVGFGFDVAAFNGSPWARQGPHRRRRQPDPGEQRRRGARRVVQAGRRQHPPARLQHRIQGRSLPGQHSGVQLHRQPRPALQLHRLRRDQRGAGQPQPAGRQLPQGQPADRLRRRGHDHRVRHPPGQGRPPELPRRQLQAARRTGDIALRLALPGRLEPVLPRGHPRHRRPRERHRPAHRLQRLPHRRHRRARSRLHRQRHLEPGLHPRPSRPRPDPGLPAGRRQRILRLRARDLGDLPRQLDARRLQQPQREIRADPLRDRLELLRGPRPEHRGVVREGLGHRRHPLRRRPQRRLRQLCRGARQDGENTTNWA